MAQISINDKDIVNGILTVRRYKDEEGSVKVVGTLACHFYLEEIDTIDTYRYRVEGVNVIEEMFQSDNFDILYTFEAESISNKYGMSDLDMEEIQEIEKGLYGPDGYVIGTVLNKGVSETDE